MRRLTFRQPSGRQVSPALLSAPDSPEPLEVLVSLPPVTWEVTQEAAREGRVGSHNAGHYWTLGATHYVYTVHDGQDVDPAPAGLTGIPVTLPAGNATAIEHAAAAETAINLDGTFTATADGDTLTIEGTSSAAAGPTTYESKGQSGLLGMQYEAPSGSFGVDTFRIQYIDPTSLPSTGTIRIDGWRIRWGSNHSGQLTAALYQGGTIGVPDTDLELVASMGVTSGSVTNDNVYVTLPTPIYLDLADGPIAIGWMGDGGGTAISSVSTSGQAASATSDFFNGGGGTAIWISGGSPPSGSGGTFPAAFTPGGASFTFVTSFGLVYSVGPFHNDMFIKGRIGTRFEGTFTEGTSDATLAVGNSYTLPDIEGAEIDRWEVNYDTHVSGSDYRGAWATGGTAGNWSGSDWADLGQTTGTDTGWSGVNIPEGTSIPISEGLAFLTIRGDFANVGGTSVLAFDATVPTEFGGPEDPAAYYDGQASESERTPAGGTTNISFDPIVPLTGIVTPDGTNLTPGNNVGVRAQYRVPGFAVV